MKFNYTIEKDDIYFNTFQIWDVDTGLPLDLNDGDIDVDNKIVTDFHDMQCKANEFTEAIETIFDYADTGKGKEINDNEDLYFFCKNLLGKLNPGYIKDKE